MLREVRCLLRWEHVPAFGALAVSGVDDGVALRAGLRGGVAATAFAGLLRLYHVQRPVPHDVAAVVQNQAVRLARVGREACAASGHLEQQSRGVGRAHQHHAVRVRGVESGCQHRAVG